MSDFRQAYHLEPPTGLLNDPNGFCFYKGRYHLFFQWNRFAKDHTHKEWGHFSSADLVHWEFHYGAIVPDMPYDHSGVHSGSALVLGDELLLFYTGSDKQGSVRRSHQCLASTADARTFVKEGVVVETPRGFTGHVRDPKVFRAVDGSLRMVLGAQRSCGKASAIMFASADGRSWRYLGTLATSDSFEMCECPDLLDLGGQHVLMYCPQRRDNEHDLGGSSYSCYKPVLFDEETGSIDDTSLDGGTLTEAGFDFYAPQTMRTEDGRTLLVAWMDRLTDEQGEILAGAGPAMGCLTVPRELSWREGALCQVPARELIALRGVEHAFESITGGFTTAPVSRAYWLSACGADLATDFDISLNGGSEHVCYDACAGELALTRTDWASGATERRTAHVGALRSLELLSDRSSIEVFANGGEAAMTARVLPEGESAQVLVKGLRDVGNLRLWDIAI